MSQSITWGGITLTPRRILPDGTILPADAVAWEELHPGVWVVGLATCNWCVVRREGTECLTEFTGAPEWGSRVRDRASDYWMLSNAGGIHYSNEFQHGWTWPTKIDAETAFATWLLLHQD